MPDQGPNLDRALQELERRQTELEQAQQELQKKTVVGRSRDRLVTVRARVLGGITSVKFDGAIFDQHDEESLGAAVLEAINQAMTRSTTMFQQTVGDLMALPELDELVAIDDITDHWADFR